MLKCIYKGAKTLKFYQTGFINVVNKNRNNLATTNSIYKLLATKSKISMTQLKMKEHPQLPDNNKFGWFFFSLLVAVALYVYLYGEVKYAILSIIGACFFATATIIAPEKLTMLNLLWHYFGKLLGKLFNPLILGALFFVLITPIALIGKLRGYDKLNLKFKKQNKDTYWIDRDKTNSSDESFKNQY